MTVADAQPDLEHLDRSDRAFLGHPKGLGYLGFTEGCERFSYYSMQTLLVLYMVNYLLVPGRMENVVGLDWLNAHVYPGLSGQPLASAIFGTYTALVSLTPILGGSLADKWLGRNVTLITGGVLMAIGHFLMAIEPAFLLALLALLLGVGAFKGNIATQVGALYGPNDLRRAMAFQIFYIFINVSVIAAPLVSGTLGQKVGWHYGFGCAGVVMVLGLIIYLAGQKHLPADNKPVRGAGKVQREKLTRDDWLNVVYLLILIPVLAISLLTNQEIFNAYLVWGDQHFDLTLLNDTSSWLITLDAAFGTEHGGRGWEALGKRVVAGGIGLIYLYLSYKAVRVVLAGRAGTMGTAEQADTVLDLPGGDLVLSGVAVGLVIAGMNQLWKAIRCRFMRRLREGAGEKEWIKWMGRLGYAARGIIFLVVAWTVYRAATDHRATEAGNLESALDILRGPFLAPIAAGLMLFGLFSLVEARYRRIHRPPVEKVERQMREKVGG